MLYGGVRAHLETFLAHTRETYEKSLPRYVEKEFRSVLKCGVFAHGFLMACFTRGPGASIGSSSSSGHSPSICSSAPRVAAG